MITIQDRLSKPNLELLGKIDFSKLFLGVEIEFELLNPSILLDTSLTFVEESLGDFVILKMDDSVKDGYEICSRPASLDYHKEKWGNFFKGVSNYFRNHVLEKGEEKDFCGMHVHMSREGLSVLQIGKIVAFIHRPENYKFVSTIAERESNEFCNYKILKDFKDSLQENVRKAGRKVGVNLHNQKTIEIRIFKTPLDYKQFLKNLEFCHALIKFTTPSTVSLQESVEYQKFVNFIHENHKDYPNLFAFLQKKKFIIPKE